jgi:hypothetical protein
MKTRELYSFERTILSDSSDEDPDAEAFSETKEPIRERLRVWGRSWPQIPQICFNQLLTILKEEGLDVPKDCRTLLGNKMRYDITQDGVINPDGDFVYIGVANGLDEVLANNPEYEKDEIWCNFNADGLPLNKNGVGKGFTPLLMSTNVNVEEVSVLAIHCSEVSCKDEAVLLTDFAKEMKDLMENGYTSCRPCPHVALLEPCPQKTFDVKFDFITADLPAMAMIKGTKGNFFCK